MDGGPQHATNDTNKVAGAKSKRRRNKKKKSTQQEQQQQQQQQQAPKGSDNVEGHAPPGEPKVVKNAPHSQPSPQVAVERREAEPGVRPVDSRQPVAVATKTAASVKKAADTLVESETSHLKAQACSAPVSAAAQKNREVDSGKDAAAMATDESASRQRTASSEVAGGEKATAQGIETVAGEGGEPAKSKAQLRAERRAKQEQQRAAKVEKLAASGKAPPPAKGGAKGAKGDAGQEQGGAAKTAKAKVEVSARKEPATPKKDEAAKENELKKEAPQPLRVMDDVRHDDPQLVKKRQKKMEKQKICPRADIRKKVDLFSHLPQYEIGSGLLTDDWQAGTNTVDPSVYRCGILMAYGKLMGAHARCSSLIESVMRIILCYKFDNGKEFARDFENKLSPSITFLSQCRPMTAGMRGFIKHFKAHVGSVGRDDDLDDDERKRKLLEVASGFRKEKLSLARQTISELAETKINDNDCILVFAFSSLVQLVLKHAWIERDRRFRVIVADSDPLWEGRLMLRFLETHNIPCEYVSLCGVPSIMPRVTRVFLGAQALLNNGSVLSRAGTGLIATLAHEFRCSVIVCCESYKFWERVQLDSFVYNELGDPNALIDNDGMRELWDDPNYGLHYLNPIYDITSSDLVDMVITERGIMPATSVPVVLRSKNAVF